MKTDLNRDRPLGVLSHFKQVLPRYRIEQKDLLDWLSFMRARAQPSEDQRAAQRYTAGSLRKIHSRWIETENVLENRADPEFYKLSDSPTGPSMTKRMAFFSSRAAEVFEKIYADEELAPSNLIHVTCTGYVSPSAPQRLVELRGWHGKTEVTHAYHMGCYASIPAIRMAAGAVAISERPTDILHTEICSLHLNPADLRPDQLIVQSLFADGHIRYRLSPPGGQNGSFEVLTIREYIIPNSQECMTWTPTEWGMEMSLSRNVPRLISEQLPTFLEQLSSSEDSPVFAIHPGGPTIIEQVQEVLGLKEDQIKHSLSVFSERGNMSSATLPHIWKSIAEDPSIPSGKQVISLAFGPGLTIFGALFRKC